MAESLPAWTRARRKSRRVFSFVALSAVAGVRVWKPVWTAVPYVTGWTLLAGAGVALKADVLVILLAVALATAMTLAAGAFHLWDGLDEANEEPKGNPASATVRERPDGELGPDVVRFGVAMADPSMVLNLAGPGDRGAARAVRFRKPVRLRVSPSDIPVTLRWGRLWRRREVHIKGFSESELLLERVGPVPDPWEVEVYFDT
jgi:hypothetical protein